MDNERPIRRAVRKGKCMVGTIDTWIIWVNKPQNDYIV